MRVSRSFGAVAALVVTANLGLDAESIPAVKLPPSPQGQSAVQLGGRWEKAASGHRYVDGKWVVVDYAGRSCADAQTSSAPVRSTGRW